MNLEKAKFLLGHLVASRGVHEWVDKNQMRSALLGDCITRHVNGDWGEVCDEDKVANDEALKNGERLLSAYTVADQKIWIITEWDRSVTTILFPDEY